MFESLTEKITSALEQLRHKGRIRKSDLDATLRKVKMSLLEGDVHFRVVQDFIESLDKSLQGVNLLPTLKPEQQIVGVLQEEMEKLLGEPVEQKYEVTLLVGLQGSGKTTSAAKLAHWLVREKQQTPLLVPADLSRPAAIDQLKRLGSKHNLRVFDTQPTDNVAKVCETALDQNRKERPGTPTIIDSAGRLQIDDELMAELTEIVKRVKPTATLLVVDAMTGQEAVNVAKSFHAACPLTGIILTKMDGDARGGAALSIRAATNVPVQFLGIGEAVEAFDTFEAKRIASRILGMGDMSGLMERAKTAIDNDAADDIGDFGDFREFTLRDFLKMFRLMKKMGPLQGVLGMIPGFSKISKGLDVGSAEDSLKRVQAMILSMTEEERLNPNILNGSRRKRIALGSGTNVPELNRFLKQYTEMKKLIKRMGPEGVMSLIGR